MATDAHTPPEASVREVESVIDLLSGIELVDVRTYVLHAERGVFEATDEARIAVATKLEGTLLEVRCRLSTSAEDADMVVDRAAIFSLREAWAIPVTVMGEFVEKVGVMTVYPFLREGVFTLASNLGVAPPVIGLLRAGSITLTPDPEGSTFGGARVPE